MLEKLLKTAQETPAHRSFDLVYPTIGKALDLYASEDATVDQAARAARLLADLAIELLGTHQLRLDVLEQFEARRAADNEVLHQ